MDSNTTRKDHIATQIIKQNPETVGIYRLTMKTDSDNFRQAAIVDILKEIRAEGIEVIIHEPVLEVEEYKGYQIVNDLDQFKADSDIILANRFDDELVDVKEKIYTRDLYNEN